MKKTTAFFISLLLIISLFTNTVFASENIQSSILDPQGSAEAVFEDLPQEETQAEELPSEQAAPAEEAPHLQEMPAEGETELTLVPTPDTEGQLIFEDTVDSRETESVFRSMLSSTAITNFTNYGDQLLDMTVSVGDITISNFGKIAKTAYDALNDDINKGENGNIFSNESNTPSGISVSFANQGFTTEQIKELTKYIAVASYYAVDWDNPAMFFSNGNVSFKASQSGTTLTVSVFPYMSNEFKTLSLRQSVKRSIDAKVAEVVAQANSASSTAYGRIEYFDNWLCQNNIYNSAAANAGKPADYGSSYPWSSASGLLSGFDSSIKAPVCEGYARAMQTLCMADGITCTVLIGSNHMWNNIKVDGIWYGNDTTWNDSTGTKKYFLTASLNNSRGHSVEGVGIFGIYFSYPDLGTATYPSKLILDQSELSLDIGEKAKLTVTVLPADSGNQAVTWVSSNVSAAKIDSDGTVTAMGSGTADITVKTANGISAVCKVNVGGEVEAFVERLYTLVLGRKSDKAGKAQWAADLKSGKSTGAVVARGFVLSDEMQKRNLSDEAFVEVLYNTFFNRASDKTGFDDWVSCLKNGMSREYVMCGFANSNEFEATCKQYEIIRGTVKAEQPRDMNRKLTEFVNRLYATLLDRAGEEAGLNDWCSSLLLKSKTPKQVAYGFVFSNEMISKNYSNADFTEHMYIAFLGRASDPNGKAYWINRMNNGLTRQQLFDGFADSNEFAGIVADFGL